MAAVLMEGVAQMRKFALVALLSSMALAFWQGASGAEMSEPKGPSFAVGADTLLSGNEPEFSSCKQFQIRYLTSIAARTEAIAYAYSADWGYVLRAYYASMKSPEKGTLICWRPKQLDEVHFLVDVPGTAADLEVSR